MKIALAGKGGSGKTTLAAGLAKTYSKNFKVLVIDADSSLNLSVFFNNEDIVLISEMRKVVDMNPDVRDMINKYSIKIDNNLNLLAMGTVLRCTLK